LTLFFEFSANLSPDVGHKSASRSKEAYTSANFSATADSEGNVEIVDPTIPNGGSVHASSPANGRTIK
jgi:hypothetical protein